MTQDKEPGAYSTTTQESDLSSAKKIMGYAEDAEVPTKLLDAGRILVENEKKALAAKNANKAACEKYTEYLMTDEE